MVLKRLFSLNGRVQALLENKKQANVVGEERTKGREKVDEIGEERSNLGPHCGNGVSLLS